MYNYNVPYNNIINIQFLCTIIQCILKVFPARAPPRATSLARTTSPAAKSALALEPVPPTIRGSQKRCLAAVNGIFKDSMGYSWDMLGCYGNVPSGNVNSLLLKMAIYSGFSHQKW